MSPINRLSAGPSPWLLHHARPPPVQRLLFASRHRKPRFDSVQVVTWQQTWGCHGLRYSKSVFPGLFAAKVILTPLTVGLGCCKSTPPIPDTAATAASASEADVYQQLIRSPMFNRAVQKAYRKINKIPDMEPKNGGGRKHTSYPLFPSCMR